MKAKVLFCNPLLSRIMARRAFTLIELLVVIFTVAIMAVMIVPALAKTRSNDQRITCVYNLKQVGLSFRLWGQAKGGRYPQFVAPNQGGAQAGQAITSTTSMNSLAGATAAGYTFNVFQVMSNELGTPNIVVCPSDGDRGPKANFGAAFGNPLAVGGNVSVSYFVGKEADESNPRMLLSGDRNMGEKPAAGWTGVASPGGVTGYSPNAANYPGSYQQVSNRMAAVNANFQWTDKMHQTKGNVCLTDGSVQQFTSVRLRGSINDSGTSGWTYFP